MYFLLLLLYFILFFFFNANITDFTNKFPLSNFHVNNVIRKNYVQKVPQTIHFKSKVIKAITSF